MMKGRSIAVLAILLVALASTTSFEARQTGIVTEGGCGCHGGMSSDTVITVDGFQMFSMHQKSTSSHLQFQMTMYQLTTLTRMVVSVSS